MSEVNSCCGTTCDKAKAVAEYDALRAQVSAMRYELAACQSVLFQLARGGEVTPAYADDAKRVLDATPAQCLAAVQSAAVEKFTTALGAAWRSDWDTQEISEFADEYVRGIK